MSRHPDEIGEDGIVPDVEDDKPPWMAGLDFAWACPEHNMSIPYRIGDGSQISKLRCPVCNLRPDGTYLMRNL